MVKFTDDRGKWHFLQAISKFEGKDLSGPKFDSKVGLNYARKASVRF